MPLINLEMYVMAPPDRCFDLSGSIDLHKDSISHTHEEATGGVITGLIGMGEHVTWRARHFGVFLSLTSRITAFDRPHSFTDEMVSGPFHSFTHRHIFMPAPGGTLMRDEFHYISPLGPLGRLADSLFLKRYMSRLLETRNRVIRNVAESDAYHQYLS